MNRSFLHIIILLGVLLLPSSVLGEDISNYSECDVCHGSIHLNPIETKLLLGEEGRKFVQSLGEKQVVIKVDAHGKLAPASAETPNKEYEMLVWVGGSALFIKDTRDDSLIQLVLDKSGASQGLEMWQPHIYAESGKVDEIVLTDTVATGWSKFSSSSLAQWLGKKGNTGIGQDEIRNGIVKAMNSLKEKM